MRNKLPKWVIRDHTGQVHDGPYVSLSLAQELCGSYTREFFAKHPGAKTVLPYTVSLRDRKRS